MFRLNRFLGTRREWAVYLVGTLAATGLYVLLPKPTPASAATYLAAHLALPVAIVVGLRANRPANSRPWLVILIGIATYIVGDLAYYGPQVLGSAEYPPVPSIADLFFLASYGILLLGLGMLVRQRLQAGDRESAMDGIVVAASLGSVYLALSLAPLYGDPASQWPVRIVQTLYPLADIGLLAAGLALAFSANRPSASLLLLIGGLVLQATADAAFALSFSAPPLLEVAVPAWLASFGLFGAAALHPSMAGLGRPDEGSPIVRPQRRVALLLIARMLPLIPLAVLLAVDGSGAGLVSLAAATTVLTLFGVRVWHLFQRAENRNRDLRRAARELRASYARVDEIVATVPGIIYRGRLVDGALEYISPNAEQFLGWTPEESVGQPNWWLDRIHPNDRAGFTAALAAARAAPDRPLVYELRAEHKKGGYRWVLATIRYLADERGVSTTFAGTAIDVSDRKRAEEDLTLAHAALEASEAELRQANAYLNDLLASIPVVLFRARGPEFTTEYVSPSVERVLGFTPEEVLATPGFWLARMPAEDRAAETARARAADAQALPTITFEHRMVARDGRERWMYTVAHNEIGADGVPRYTGTSFDITDRRAAEDELRRAKEEAEQASLVKGEFLSRISHELRTPLNAVLGFGQLLERSELGADDRESVEHIQRGGRRLLEIIDDLLDFSRIEVGHLTLSIEAMDLREVISEAADLIRPLAARSGIPLELPGAGEEPLFVLADRIRLRQVMLNLLSNAVKFNHPGGSVQVCVVRPAGGDRVRVSVADTGPGIAAERQATLFSAFDHERTDGRVTPGLGVGLALSARLMAAMGASISVTSQPGSGSTFTIELPAADQPLVTNDRLRGPDEEPKPVTVLYIEDNLANLALVERIIGHTPGIRLVAAMQGRLGLELARQQEPDLILLDYHLPDADAPGILEELRRDPALASVPVVVLSSAGETIGPRMLRLGATACLAKPIDVAALQGIVDDLLGAAARHG